MGLDMYLSAKFSTCRSFDEKEKEHKVIPVIRKVFPEIFSSGNLDSIDISFEVGVGYWRKANEIHNWFVQNIQDGEDNCHSYYVSRDNLIILRDLCKKILKNKSLAKELLPTKEGFFFGGTEYDEWYFKSLRETVQVINKCLKLPEGWMFYYESSW